MLCNAPFCERKRVSKGYCDKHYRRLRSGRPLGLKYAYEKTISERFSEMIDEGSAYQCWNWKGGMRPDGYGCFCPGKASAIRTKLAHRVAYELHNNESPGGMLVLHHCDNRKCVNPAHLFLGTHETNMADMGSKGRRQVGERHHFAKLTEDEVREIRLSDKASAEIAKEFGISKGSVWLIKSRKTWKHIK